MVGVIELSNVQVIAKSLYFTDTCSDVSIYAEAHKYNIPDSFSLSVLKYHRGALKDPCSVGSAIQQEMVQRKPLGACLHFTTKCLVS